MQASNTNHNPTTSPTWWIEVSPTNRWKMFDTSNTTTTENANTIEISLLPGKAINPLALLGVIAAEVTVVMTDPIDGVVYNQTFQLLDTSGITNWYAYFFTELKYKKQLIITELPSFKDATLDTTITNTGSTAKCGVCVIGTTQL